MQNNKHYAVTFDFQGLDVNDNTVNGKRIMYATSETTIGQIEEIFKRDNPPESLTCVSIAEIEKIP